MNQTKVPYARPARKPPPRETCEGCDFLCTQAYINPERDQQWWCSWPRPIKGGALMITQPRQIAAVDDINRAPTPPEWCPVNGGRTDAETP